LSPTQASKVDAIISTPRLKVDRMKMIKILVKEGINDFDVEGFLYVFNGMNWNVDGEIDE
jgi:hypothetical protein